MNRAKLIALTSALGSLVPGLASADPGELSPIAINTQGNNYGYFEYLPEAYDESEDWPVLIFLSGIGEFGNGTLPQPANACPNGPNYNEPVLCRNLRHGPQNLIYRQEVLGQNGLWDDEDRPFVVIAPQNNATLWSYTPYSVTAMATFMDYIVDTYAVDERRIYLTGMSMGGYSVTLLGNANPDLFAAIAPMPGINGVPAADVCNNFTRHALWIFHGENDGNPFNPTAMVTLGNQYNNCPEPHPTARITMYDNAGHDVWTRTINPLLGMDDPVLNTWVAQGQTVSLVPYDIDLYTWLLSHDKPDVDAGDDVVTGAASVMLSANTLDEDAIEYTWSQTGGAAATINGGNTATPTVTGLALGTYTFEVLAIDADDQWDSDEITVEVVEGGGEEEGGETTGGGEAEAEVGGEAEAEVGGEAEAEVGGEAEAEVGGEAGEAGGESTGDETTGGGEEDPLDALDDDFDDPSLAQWTVVNPAQVTASVAGGSLTLTPAANSAWHTTAQAGQHYQTVTGDFAVTAAVTVTNASGGLAVPAWRLGGLMMRNPGASNNTFHGAFGTVGAWLNNNNTFEWTNTVNNVSSLGSVTNASGTGQIRLCRVGAEVRAYFRPDAVSSWTLVNTQQRADFGASLAVGPMSFSRNSPADVRARFDWVDYATITSMNDCENIGVSLRESDVDLGLAAAPSVEADEGDDVAGAEGCACSTDSKRGGGLASAVLLLGLLGLRRRRRA